MNERYERHCAVGRLLKRVERAKGAAGDRALASLGLTMSLWVVLRLVAKFGEMSANAMAEANHVTPQSFGEMVQKLLGRDLIRKKATHGRAVLYELTEQGTSLLGEAEARMRDVLEKTFSPLSEEETELLENLLKRVADESERNEHAHV